MDACDPAIDECEIPEEDPWIARGERKTYLWYTLVLGSNSFLQWLIPFILWFGAIQKPGMAYGDIA